MFISKEDLEKDMYELFLSQQEIAKKYNVGKETIQSLQTKYGLEILNIYKRRIPESFTQEQKEMIYGTIIADGHIFRKSSNKNGALKICHTIKHEEYIDYKYQMIKDFVRTKPSIQISRVQNSTNIYKSFRTLTHPFFTEIHNMIYYFENGKNIKHLNKNIIEKLTPFSLAIAFMDDGTKHHYEKDFCFECFSFSEQQLLCDYLKDKYNIEARVIRYNKTKNRTRILRKSIMNFNDLIQPYILNCMKYKL